MRHIILATLILGLLFFGFNQADNKTVSVTEQKTSTSTDDKEQIQNLIKQVFEWVDSKDAISEFPAKTDEQDSIILGVDLEIHKRALVKLRQTNLFAGEFIDNYNQIVLTIDEGLKNDKYGQWLVGEYPPFSFASGWNPWCCSQGYCAGESFEIKIIKIDNETGEIEYKRTKDSSWSDFVLRVKKENGKWKISYLEGFDFEKGIKKVGEL